MAKCCDLFDPTDPAILQPEQRQREVAAILAAGVIRMREQRAVTCAKGPVMPELGTQHHLTQPPQGGVHVGDFAGIRRSSP